MLGGSFFIIELILNLNLFIDNNNADSYHPMLGLPSIFRILYIACTLLAG